MEREELEQLSNEELDARLQGEPEEDNSLEEESAPEVGESDEEVASQEEEITTEEEEIPEKFRGKGVKEILKSYQELEKQMGRYSRYKPFLDYLELAPEMYDRVLKYLVEGEKATEGQVPQNQQQVQEQIDEADAIIKKLEEEGYDELVPVIKTLRDGYKRELEALRNEIHGWQKKQQEEYVTQKNLEAIQNFVQKYPMENENLVQFLSMAEQVIRPSGKMGEYTPQDLENAYKILHPQEYERRIREQVLKELRSASGTDNTASASSVQHRADFRTVKKALETEDPEALADLVQGLSDEELDELLEKKGLGKAPKVRFR